MFVYPGLLRWKDIHDGLGIHAEGSCYFITVLLAHIIINMKCETQHEFEMSYSRYIGELLDKKKGA
jgi:hypothetical protein